VSSLGASTARAGTTCESGEPLRVTATIAGGISLPDGQLALDSLLAAAVALSEGLDPPAHTESPEFVEIEIPVQREPGGKFHLASFSISTPDAFETDWLNRRFPIEEGQALGGPKLRRVSLGTGPGKSYRIPRDRRHLEHDRLTWFCVGDAERIRHLLEWCPYIGKKRSVGLGRVREWRVETVESWGDGFPIVLDGRPLRTLPAEWPGLQDPVIGYRVLSFPYWAHTRAQLCAVP